VSNPPRNTASTKTTECNWREINKKAAYSVDRVSAREYEENLDENIRDLVERLKRKRYRSKNPGSDLRRGFPALQLWLSTRERSP